MSAVGRLPSVRGEAGSPLRSLRGGARRTLYPAGGLLAFLAVWWLSIVTLVGPDSFLREFSPEHALVALAQLVWSGEIVEHAATSLRRIVVGLTLAALAGLPLGLALGSLPRLADALGPLTGFIRMISPLSWTPLAIVLFGVGDPPVYFLIAIGAMWPIVLSTSASISGLDPRWLLVGRALGGGRFELLRTITWPGIRSGVLNGLRLAMSTAWIILVPAEMLGVDSGLGFFILDARDRFAYDEVVAAIIAIGLIGIALDRLARHVFTTRRRAPSAAASPSAPAVDAKAPDAPSRYAI